MAAVEFLQAEGSWEVVSARAVYGENINQTLQFVATGNAIVGFIAKSQLGAPQLPEPDREPSLALSGNLAQSGREVRRHRLRLFRDESA